MVQKRTDFGPNEVDFECERANFGHERGDFRVTVFKFKPEIARFEPERLGGGLQRDRQTETHFCILQVIGPLVPLPKKLVGNGLD